MTSNDFNPDGENRRRPVTARELRKAKGARERQEMELAEKEIGEEKPVTGNNGKGDAEAGKYRL